MSNPYGPNAGSAIYEFLNNMVDGAAEGDVPQWNNTTKQYDPTPAEDIGASPQHVKVDLLSPPNSSATAGTALVTQVSTLFFGGRQLWQSPTQNDEITYNVLLDAGTYTLALFHEATTDVGIYHVEFDGTEVGTIDGYAASSTATRSLLTGLTIASSGLLAVTLKMASKNASSSGYRIRVSGMTLTRTGA